MRQHRSDSQSTKPHLVQVFLRVRSSADCCLYSKEVPTVYHLRFAILRHTVKASDVRLMVLWAPGSRSFCWFLHNGHLTYVNPQVGSWQKQTGISRFPRGKKACLSRGIAMYITEETDLDLRGTGATTGGRDMLHRVRFALGGNRHVWRVWAKPPPPYPENAGRRSIFLSRSSTS